MTDQGRILLVEDNPDDEALTLRALKKNHIMNEVVVARDGVEALDWLAKTQVIPQVILLDLNMPKLDGREALQRIKGDPTLVDIPIVILTTSGLDADVIRSYRLGVNSFITKPVTFSGLVDAMNVLGRYWLEIVELPPVPAAV